MRVVPVHPLAPLLHACCTSLALRPRAPRPFSSTPKMSASRSVRVVKATPFGPPRKPGGPVLNRVIGSKGLDDKGTGHAVGNLDADPWLLVDEGHLRRDTEMPFGDHPHTGFVANTYNFYTHQMCWDNVQCSSREELYGPLWAKGLFQINSGRGVLHGEGDPVPDSIMEANPSKKIPESHTMQQVLQMWFNPGMHLPGAMEKQVETNIIPPEDIPEITQDDGLFARVVIGAYGDAKSPAKTWGAEVFMMDCTLLAGKEATLAVPSTNACWVYNLSTSKPIQVTCGGSSSECPTETLCLYSVGDETAVKVKAPADGDVHFAFGGGKPWGQPVFKMLGHDGALIGPSEEYVRAKMKEFEEKHLDFGR